MSSSDEMELLEAALRARIEYEISDASRDGPRTHRDTIILMDALREEASRQVESDAARVVPITQAAQHGRQALVEELIGSASPEDIAAWLEAHRR